MPRVDRSTQDGGQWGKVAECRWYLKDLFRWPLSGVRDRLAVCYQSLCLSLDSVICMRCTWPEAARQLAAVSFRSCMSCLSVEGSPMVWIDLSIPPWEGFIAWQMKAFFWASVVDNHPFLCKYTSWRMSPKRNSLCCIGQISQQNGRIVIILLPSVASRWKQQIRSVWCQAAHSVSTWLARGLFFLFLLYSGIFVYSFSLHNYCSSL